MESKLSNQNNNYDSICKERTLIIFDWDDTLMCTSFILQEDISLQSDSIIVHKHWEKLEKLSKSIIEIITTSKIYGEVVIITNADEGWVQMTAQKFMPEIIPIIENIEIISAKTSYEKLHPNNFYIWKYLVMKNLIEKKRYPCLSKKNILSFGDSLIERRGVQKVAKEFLNTVSKSVKFKEKSDIESLRRQIDVVKSTIKYIAEYHSDLDLQLTENKV